MKIAITADPLIPVPPLLYGGIERIVDLLVHGLMKQGHEVTLFAHRDSRVACRLIPYKAESNSAKDTLLNTYTINKVLLADKFDIVHSFGRLAYLLPQMPLHIPKLMSYQREPTVSQIAKAVKLSAKGTLAFTGCSNYITDKITTYAQAHTVYNGIDTNKYILTTTVDPDAPLVFLGRIEPIKGTHTAIEIARRTGKKLVIAGNIPDNEHGYFDTEIKPFLDERITYMGPVNDSQKNELLRNALALLMPIHWNEPFGIVMIEAMACGTPVIGFNKGAVPEVVENGVTGFCSDTIEQLMENVGQAHTLNRAQIRAITEERFSADVIVGQYLDLYHKMIDGPDMRLALSCPTIAPHVRQSVVAYYEAGYLEQFYTSFIEHPGDSVSSFLSSFKQLKTEIKRRAFHDLPIEKINTRPLQELVRTAAARKMSRVLADQIWEWSELGFDRWVARKLKSSAIDVVHTYEHAALFTLQKAKALNLFSVYEQPSQHHSFFSIIAREQIELYPELKGVSAELLLNEKAQRRNRRRDEELKLASLILCNSTFTKRTLVGGGVDPERITVLPLAFPTPKPKEVYKTDGPLVFLYAGNQSLRKASHILYLAWRECNFSEDEAALWLIGKMLLPPQLREGLPGNVMIKENIPHTEMMQVYAQADVFVLPTLADGFGMVITEAMSQGIPVIASENSCGPDVIDHGKDGWVIPAGDVTALANQMRWCVANRDKIAAMGKAASEKALTWQWPQYRKKLGEIVFDNWQKYKEIKKPV